MKASTSEDENDADWVVTQSVSSTSTPLVLALPKVVKKSDAPEAEEKKDQKGPGSTTASQTVEQKVIASPSLASVVNGLDNLKMRGKTLDDHLKETRASEVKTPLRTLLKFDSYPVRSIVVETPIV